MRSATFQHTAARRRLGFKLNHVAIAAGVSTHSRPKAAGNQPRRHADQYRVSTHSRPKAAARLSFWRRANLLFQHTAARRRLDNEFMAFDPTTKFQHTAARRRLACSKQTAQSKQKFQHTAARRRLLDGIAAARGLDKVSTHSRPKAAAKNDRNRRVIIAFQHTAARRRLSSVVYESYADVAFQHTAARRRLAAQARQRISNPTFQHTAARRRLITILLYMPPIDVSTHSRPKAAASTKTLAF